MPFAVGNCRPALQFRVEVFYAGFFKRSGFDLSLLLCSKSGDQEEEPSYMVEKRMAHGNEEEVWLVKALLFLIILILVILLNVWSDIMKELGLEDFYMVASSPLTLLPCAIRA